MTISTFHGLEVAKKALFAQQRGLYTTGHNISNVNTEGYSRQRANFTTTTPYPPQMFMQPKIPGKMGTGVKIDTVQRIRDQFLDFQYRIENSRAHYWDTRNETLTRLEQLLNEPTDNGLSNSIDRFWQSLQDLTDNVDNSGARSVISQQGLALTETFNYLSRSIQSIRGDLKDQIEVNVDNINSLVKQIHSLNEQIVKVEPHGLLPNDLYDERDRLIDQLSEFVNIKVHYSRSSEGAADIADGLASIELLDERGHSFGNGVYLLDVRNTSSLKDSINELQVEIDGEPERVTKISVSGYENIDDLTLLQSIGSLSALIRSFGYETENLDGNVIAGEDPEYPYILEELDRLARAFATAFNEQHKKGLDMYGNEGVDFFKTLDGSSTITAENITVNEEILKDEKLIAASLPDEGSQNANNILELANLFDKDLAELNDSSVRNYFTLLIGELGVKNREARTMTENTDILRSQVDDQRMAVTAVSLDEEMSNLIKFQHAYNAAARNMTALDEMLDRIINGMGLVGR